MFTVMDNLLGELKCSIRSIIFIGDDGGATATEYAMLMVFVALAIAVGAQAFGGDVAIRFISVGSALANITLPTV